MWALARPSGIDGLFADIIRQHFENRMTEG